MNLLTWFGPWQSTRALMSCVLVCMALAFSASVRAQGSKQVSLTAEKVSLTLNQALEAAWQRSLEASESRSRLAIVQADQAVNQNWLAAAPAFSIGQRDGKAASKGITGKLTVLQGSNKIEADIKEAGDNTLRVLGVKLGKGDKLVAALSNVGGKSMTVRFTIK